MNERKPDPMKKRKKKCAQLIHLRVQIDCAN